MADNGGWVSRKRRRNKGADGNDAKNSPVAPTVQDTTSTSNNNAIPSSLLPHLGWTKLSACHRPRAKKKRNNNWNRDEELQKVAGRAVFFIHDPRPDGDSSDSKDESKIWFQGRFFPTVAGQATTNNRRDSPTSVSSDRVAPNMTNNSWGLLAVQNEIIDECLTCSEGGYREMDLTFIRPKAASTMSRKEKKVRWVAEDVVWTGGNMMSLTSDPYSPSLSNDEPGVRFEPQKLMEGDRAMEVAKKYFPAMVKRLQIDSVTNESDKMSDAMLIVGDLTFVAPVSFVKMRNAGASRGGGYSSEDDGLWND